MGALVARMAGTIGLIAVGAANLQDVAALDLFAVRVLVNLHNYASPAFHFMRYLLFTAYTPP